MKNKIISILLAFTLLITCLSIAIYANNSKTAKYAITVSSAVKNGTISLNKTSAQPGEVVEVTFAPKDGFITKAGSTTYAYASSGTVTKALVNRVSENAVGKKLYFTMPETSVTVYAEFVSTADNNFSFDMVASSVKSGDETFSTGSFTAMRFVSRMYFDTTVRDINTGYLTLKVDGESKTVKEMGTLYAKTETLGAETELTVDGVGANGIKNAVAYNSADPLNDKFSDLTNSYP